MGETNQVIWTTEGQLTLRISMHFTHVYRISETPRQLHTPPQQQVAPLAAAKKEWYLLHCRCWDVLCPRSQSKHKQTTICRKIHRERERKYQMGSVRKQHNNSWGTVLCYNLRQLDVPEVCWIPSKLEIIYRPWDSQSGMNDHTPYMPRTTEAEIIMFGEKLAFGGANAQPELFWWEVSFWILDGSSKLWCFEWNEILSIPQVWRRLSPHCPAWKPLPKKWQTETA